MVLSELEVEVQCNKLEGYNRNKWNNNSHRRSS
jgi:hypothetical protein